jgi:peptidoglycan/xylan/chitin deacetylase (PgdA/CDA1 family)
VLDADALRARRLVKTGAASALAWAGADTLIASVTGARKLPVVLGYHRVVESFAAAAPAAIPAILTSRRMLEDQLDWIGRRCRFVTLDELGARLERGDDADRMAAVTFDDGYRDVYQEAFPLLRRKGIPAAVFVVTDLIGSDRLLVHDRLYLLLSRAFGRWSDPSSSLQALIGDAAVLSSLQHFGRDVPGTMVLLLRNLQRLDVLRLCETLEAEVGLEGPLVDGMLPMSWEMLAEMQREGFVVGSHTRAHAWLTREVAPHVGDELAGSRAELERRLGRPVRHFAYPDGSFNPATVGAVARAGYRFGYTTCAHRDPRYPLLTIPRHMLWENSALDNRGRFSPAVMSCLMHRIFDLVGGCSQDHLA